MSCGRCFNQACNVVIFDVHLTRGLNCVMFPSKLFSVIPFTDTLAAQRFYQLNLYFSCTLLCKNLFLRSNYTLKPFIILNQGSWNGHVYKVDADSRHSYIMSENPFALSLMKLVSPFFFKDDNFLHIKHLGLFNSSP